MRGVAAEAGWSTGALNHYFADKEELLLLAFHEVAGRLERAPDRGGARCARRWRQLLPLDAERRAEVRVWFALPRAGAHAARAGARAARRLPRLQRPAGRRAARGAGARRARARPRPRPRGGRAGGASPTGSRCRRASIRARSDAARQLQILDERLAALRSRSVTVEPLRFEDGALLVLDQRALPAEERWIRCERPEQVADCIRTLAVRGAPAIGLAAAYGLALAERPRRRRRAAARHPPHRREPRLGARAGLWPRARPAGPRPRAAREQEAADRRLAALGAERFEPGDRALTHCNAGALATGGLRHRRRRAAAAWESGRLASGLGGRDAPAAPGRAAHGLGAGARRDPLLRGDRDSSAGTLMARGLVDRVVVGADRIAANGDVANKIGTYPLAVLAARHGMPFYVAAPVSTLDPATASRRGHPDRGARPVRARPLRCPP